ncbi:MAG: hypothetical protein NT040_03185 [Bacteroidetes bacterium]|nr:hypothetical protein [Bacteroidota bacterium]
MEKTRSHRSLVLAILFLVILGCPLLLQVSGYQFKGIAAENRAKAKFPVFEMKKLVGFNNDIGIYFAGLNDYFKDNFAVRDVLIWLYCKIKLGVLNTPPFPERVVIGREGWMFLGDLSSNAISETKGIINFNESELNMITRNFSQSISFFDSAGICFYLAVAPEKSTVYGDYLPIQKSKRPTKLEQVKKRLQTIGCPVIDMKDNFKQLLNPLLFYKTDSHWNEFGEFNGYQTLMQRLKSDYPGLAVLQVDDFVIDTTFNYQGDNARLQFIPGTDRKYEFSKHKGYEVAELEKSYQVPESYHWNPATYERRFGNQKKELKILIFHDSFFREFPKFLSPGFRESVFIWSVWNKKIILTEKPDIVIFETVERNLELLLYPLN